MDGGQRAESQPVATPPPGSPPRWGLGDAAAGLALGFVLSAVAAFVWAAATGQATTADLSLAGVVFLQVGLWAGFVGVVVVASRRKGAGRLREDFGLVLRWTDVVVGVPIGLVAQLVVVPLVYLPFHVSAEKLNKPAQEMADKAHGVGFVLLAVVLVAGAPVVEELFFRGLLLRAISHRFGDWWGLAGSSVVFALVHFERLQFPALLAFGLAAGVLAVRTRRLGPGILAHAAFNALAVAALR